MKKTPKILIDTREMKPFKFSKEVETERKALQTGDYTLEGYEHIVCIERKSLIDLFGSIVTKRFFKVIARMEAFKYAFIVIEADYLDILTGNHWFIRNGQVKIHPNAVIGKIISMQTKSHIQAVFAGKRASNYVEHLLVYLFNVLEKEKKNG